MVLGGSRTGRLAVAVLVGCGLLLAGGCDGEEANPVDLEGHRYGPGSGLGLGVTVPDGAVRIGPTVISEQADGKPLSQVSLIQIEADPDEVLRGMLADLARMLPNADIEPSKLRRRCILDDSKEWIQRCRLLVSGYTASGRPLQVHIGVTPTAELDGEPLTGASGLPQARVLVRPRPPGDGPSTNLFHSPGFPETIADQEAARWPTASDQSLDAAIDLVPGTDDWEVQAGGVPIGTVYSNPRYVVVAVSDDHELQQVATSYAAAVPNRGISTEVVATGSRQTTTSYQISAVAGGPGSHLWAVDRPGADYLFLRYWPPQS